MDHTTKLGLCFFQKRSFALAEVCVALILLGVAIPYVFSTLQQTIAQCTRLSQEITCHELVDEQLGRCIAAFLTTPVDFDTVVGGLDVSSLRHNFEVHTSAHVTSQDDSTDSKMTQNKACMMTFTVTVHPLTNQTIEVSRTVDLCLSKEGL